MPTPSGSRLALAWATVRDSLWFAPTLATLAGIALALGAVRVPTPADDAFAAALVFSGGANGARGVLETIAGSLITVTGVVFSVTIVALQLASSQFTPRVLGGFVADRVNQVVLGVFIGTFTYTLLVLRTIRSAADDRETFVPHVAVTLALVLLLASIAALIVFINHAARSIQASAILHRETQRTLARIERLFPRRAGDDEEPPGAPVPLPAEPPAIVEADRAGYLQAVHAGALRAPADGPQLLVRMEIPIGAFAFPGRALASVWPASACDARVAGAVREAFLLGVERTPEQDVELGLLELSDIALRALSPGINDPTTAIHAVDRLSELLAALGARRAPDAVWAIDGGRVRLLVRHTTFERAAAIAFDQVRHYGAHDPTVVAKLLEVLRDLALVVRPALRPPLARQVEAIRRRLHREMEDATERSALDRLATEALAATGDAAPRAGGGPAAAS